MGTKIPSGGMWRWLLQRVSAALLLFFVIAHLWIEHFLHLGRKITDANVMGRLLHGFYQMVDYGLLVIVVYHGLNGFYHVMTDYTHSERAQVRLGWGLSLLGILTVVLGIDILSAFLDGQPILRL